LLEGSDLGENIYTVILVHLKQKLSPKRDGDIMKKNGYKGKCKIEKSG
jgi:hypothetical protein